MATGMNAEKNFDKVNRILRASQYLRYVKSWSSGDDKEVTHNMVPAITMAVDSMDEDQISDQKYVVDVTMIMTITGILSMFDDGDKWLDGGGSSGVNLLQFSQDIKKALQSDKDMDLSENALFWKVGAADFTDEEDMRSVAVQFEIVFREDQRDRTTGGL
ncbi:hypothetical protein N9937_00525 [bacterium]|nr:hypothetical protein [bacterium]